MDTKPPIDREVIDERFLRVWDRFKALDDALQKAEAALESYKKIANEFRGALSDQASTFLTRTEYTARHDTLLQKVSGLEQKFDKSESLDSGRSAGISSVGVIVVSCIGGLVGLVSIASLLFNVLKTVQ